MTRVSIRRAFWLSVFLHVSFVGVLSYYESEPSLQGTPAPLNVELIEAPKTDIPEKQRDLKKAKTLVEQDKINKDIDITARYLSSHNQKVLRETVAKNHGAFQNRNQMASGDGTPRGKAGNPSESTSSTRTLTKNELFGSLKDHFLKRDFRPRAQNENGSPNKAGTGPSGSRTRDYLPGKEAGLETLLSTREFVYFTYYNRIRDQLSQYWEPKIKKKLMELLQKGRRIASSEDRITKLQIILDQEGTLQKVQILSASGIQDLDSVAVEAFRAAAPFPNPPKGIIEPDGTVKIQWDFVIES